MCKSDYQVGVFPVTEEGKVVLVTTRGSEYWIFPKGRTEKGKSDRDVAREEAHEEAGLEGFVRDDYYEFEARSRRAKKLRLYPMRVEEIKEKYPESSERKRVLVSFSEAEKLLQEDLRVALRAMRKVAS